MDASGANQDPRRRRDTFVEHEPLSYYTADESEIKYFLSHLVKNKVSLIACNEAIAALPVTIRDNMVKQLFAVAKNYISYFWN